MNSANDKSKFIFAIILFFVLTLLSTVVLETFFNKGDASRAITAIKNTPSRADSELKFDGYVRTMVQRLNDSSDNKFSSPDWSGVVTSTFYGTVRVQCILSSTQGPLVFTWQVNRLKGSAIPLNETTKTLICLFHTGIYPEAMSQFLNSSNPNS